MSSMSIKQYPRNTHWRLHVYIMHFPAESEPCWLQLYSVWPGTVDLQHLCYLWWAQWWGLKSKPRLESSYNAHNKNVWQIPCFTASVLVWATYQCSRCPVPLEWQAVERWPVENFERFTDSLTRPPPELCRHAERCRPGLTSTIF